MHERIRQHLLVCFSPWSILITFIKSKLSIILTKMPVFLFRDLYSNTYVDNIQVT